MWLWEQNTPYCSTLSQRWPNILLANKQVMNKVTYVTWKPLLKERARSTTAMDCGKGRQNMKARYLAFSFCTGLLLWQIQFFNGGHYDTVIHIISLNFSLLHVSTFFSYMTMSHFVANAKLKLILIWCFQPKTTPSLTIFLTRYGYGFQKSNMKLGRRHV